MLMFLLGSRTVLWLSRHWSARWWVWGWLLL